MTLENPSAVWWALVAVPVLILYFIRLSVYRETVGTGMFWRHVLPKTNPTLRRIASLFAQLVLIALMVAGLARLYFEPHFGSRRFLVVIDNSPSMAAVSNGKTRLSLAIDDARQLIDQMRIGDKMAIFVESHVVRPLCRMTSYRKQLHDSLTDVFIAGRQGNGHRPAAKYTSGLCHDEQLIVIGDACVEMTMAAPAFDTKNNPYFKYVKVGEPENNVAVTRVAARRGLLDSNVAEILIEVESFTDDQLIVPLIVTLDGAELAREDLKLPANCVWRKTFRLEGVSGGKLTARLDHVDGLAADNTVVVDLPPLETSSVEVVGVHSESFSKALAAVPNIHVLQDSGGDANLRVYLGDVPPLDVDVPTLVINPSSDNADWQVGEYQYDIAATQDDRSPLVQGLSLEEVVYERVRALTPRGNVRIAATGTTRAEETYPLLFSYESNPRRVVLAVDLEQTDLNNRRDLPKLLANIFAWLLPPSEEYRVGVSPIDDHELRATPQISETSVKNHKANILDYPWWHWPCWYLAIVLALALLPIEWWLYQRRIIA